MIMPTPKVGSIAVSKKPNFSASSRSLPKRVSGAASPGRARRFVA
jgi:hypothetical protein